MIRLATISALLALGTCTVAAQTTNLFLNAYFVLSGFVQAPNNQAVAVRIINKDILSALNATGNFTFGSGAQLVLRMSNNQLPTFFVRQTNGVQVVTTDVSNFLTLAQTTQVNANQGLVTYAIRIYTFDNLQGVRFSVTGFATIFRGPVSAPGVGTLIKPFNAGAQTVGSGTLNGAQMVLQGPIYAGFPFIELSF
jgi:hypothetical protein